MNVAAHATYGAKFYGLTGVKPRGATMNGIREPSTSNPVRSIR